MNEILQHILSKLSFNQDNNIIVNDDTGATLAVVPDDHHIADLEDILPNPVRTKAKKTFSTIDGFSDYVNQFKKDNTVIFFKPALSTGEKEFSVLNAVINYHEKDQAHWCDHEAEFMVIKSPELHAWERMQGKLLNQREFIQFLQEQTATIAAPSMSELISSLKNISTQAKGKNTSSVEAHNTKTEANAELIIEGVPEEITLKLPLFRMGEEYQMKVALNVVMSEGVCIICKLLNYDAIIIHQLESFAAITHQKTEIKAFV